MFSDITATQAVVHFAPPEHLATTPLNCELYLYEKTLKATPRKLPLISYNATISLTLNNLANYEMYFVKMKYWEMFNTTVVYSTESYLLVTKQGIPGKVSSASVARRNVTSSEYAVFWLVWDPPKTKNGIIKGYKVFISAKTTEGFGPEEKLEISVGTPSSHRNRTISGNEREDDDSDFNRFLNISREDFELPEIGLLLVPGYYTTTLPFNVDLKTEPKSRRNEAAISGFY
uniref:Fibronectin type-III domain-containing protein n=1 Tax=Angiostrongylus cantonensis TaxID=6313 RepID=A0A158PBG0_ANGCA